MYFNFIVTGMVNARLRHLLLSNRGNGSESVSELSSGHVVLSREFREKRFRQNRHTLDNTVNLGENNKYATRTALGEKKCSFSFLCVEIKKQIKKVKFFTFFWD